MTRKTQKNLQQGFTLIEVLLTMALIGASLVMYHLTSTAVYINRWNRYKEIALRIADNKMENLRTAGYSSLPDTAAFNDSLMSTLPNGTGTVTINTVNSKTKDVIVTVSWTNPQNTGNQTVSLETYITQGGLQ